MNILFYLVPKSEVVYLYDDFSLRQALEKMEHHRYSSIPVIDRRGHYVGTLTEGDILWELKHRRILDIREAEDIPIRQFPHKRDNAPVNVNCEIEDLVMTAMTQNFVPVIDDNGTFIGIVTRKSIIDYCYNQYKAVVSPEKERQGNADESVSLV
jgi:CBS domain-containing protein